MTAPDLNAGQPTSTQPEPATRTQLTKTQKGLIGTVVAGSAAIAGIGFAGSYRAVTKLATDKGFGAFAYALPIGIDAGIVVLLALDLVLTGLRMPFPLLRQTAWFLTAATIAFNASSAWGDWLAVGMHATIPTLFIVVTEAARHAVGRIAAITTDTHYENPPLIRWILSPVPTYRIWRRMRLWNLRSYNTVITLEKQRREYKVRLRIKHGRGWRRTANERARLAMALSRFGTPVHQTLAEPATDQPAGPDRLGPLYADQLDRTVDGNVDRPALNGPDRTAETDHASGPDRRTAEALDRAETTDRTVLADRTTLPGPDQARTVTADRTRTPDRAEGASADRGPDRAGANQQAGPDRTAETDLNLNDTEQEAVDLLRSTGRSISKRSIADVVRNELGRSISSDRAAEVARHYRALHAA